MVYIALENLAHPHEDGLAILDDHRIRRDTHLALRERIERVAGLLHIRPRIQIDKDIRRCGRVILNAGNLEVPLLHRRLDARDNGLRGGTERNLRDADKAFGGGIQLGTAAQAAVPRAIVIVTDIQQPTRGEIRIQLKGFTAQIVDGGIDQLVEIVRQDATIHAHGNTESPLGQQQRELDRQRHGLLVAAVVTQLPLRHLGTENHLLGKLGETRLDITRRRRRIAGENVTPVSLCIDEQPLLPQRYQGTADGGIPVRVVLHRIPHNVGHFVIAAIVHPVHGVQDAALHRLQSVHHMRHSSLQNHIRGVLQVVIPEHLLNDARVLRKRYRCVLFTHRRLL